jgi:hypothetical protein
MRDKGNASSEGFRMDGRRPGNGTIIVADQLLRLSELTVSAGFA